MDKKRPIIKYKRSFRNTGPKGSTGLKGLKTILPSTRKFYKPKPLSSNLSPKDYSDKIIEQQGDPLAAAVNFISGGSKPGASIVSGAKNNIVGFQRNNISPPSQNNLGSVINNISNTQSYGRATGYDILDFFGSKKTERKLRKSVQRLRNSLTETFEIAKFLRITINRIAKQLKDIPSISGGGGGGGGALGLIAGLIGGVVKLIGSVIGQLAGWVISLFARIGLGGAARRFLPRMTLGGLGVLGVLGLGSSFMNKVNAQETDFDIQRKEESETTDTREKNTTTFEKIINKFKQAVDLLLSGGKARQNGQDQPPVTPQQSLVPSSQTPLSGSEEDLLKRLMIAEAGGEGEMGMALVARSVMNRAGLIQSGKTRAGTFNAASGSITDIIQASKQYTPYAEGKLNRALTPEEDARATKALELARNQASMRGNLEAQGKSSTEINNLMGSTGFRNYNAGAGVDPSQQVNETQFGRHTFNTAGNANLISAQQVNFGNVPAGQLNPEVSLIQMPADSGGVQAAPSSGAAPAIPSQTKGPSIAFLPSNNFDSYAGLSAKMIYNIVEA